MNRARATAEKLLLLPGVVHSLHNAREGGKAPRGKFMRRDGGQAARDAKNALLNNNSISREEEVFRPVAETRAPRHVFGSERIF